MKKTALVLLVTIMAMILCFSSSVEAGTKKSNTKYSSTYKKNTTKKSINTYSKKNNKKSYGKNSYKKSAGRKSSKSSKCVEWPDCDDYWDEDEFLDDWDGNMPDDSDAMDYWDNW